MHISITDDLKKRFHAACALRGLRTSQVITELVEQWLQAKETSQIVGKRKDKPRKITYRMALY